MSSTTVKPVLHIVRGLPGSGKTTFAQKMQREGVVDAYFEADQFFYNSEGYNFNGSHINAAHNWCANSVERFMTETRRNVCVSHTFVKKFQMNPYTRMAEDLGYQVVVHVMDGDFQSVHAPEGVRERMQKEWES